MTPNPDQATILVVEDDSAVLTLVRIILENGGFEVLTADSVAKALQLDTEFRRPIHLLVSDIVMPEMTGPDLATLLKARRQSMRVMLMSAFPDGALLVLNYGWHFIAKPFVPEALLHRVKDVLASSIEEQGTTQFDTREGLARPRKDFESNDNL